MLVLASGLLQPPSRNRIAPVAVKPSIQTSFVGSPRITSRPPKSPPTKLGRGGAQPTVGSEYDNRYWYHPQIHNFGNIGPGGAFHAFFAPLATVIIDQTSYSGLNVRKMVHSDPKLFPPGASVLDLCCGTGSSVAPAGKRMSLGVDTSPYMLSMARFLRPDANFAPGNAETYGKDKSFDVVSLMFATHEMPVAGRRRVIRNAMRVAKDSVVIVDIDPDFEDTLRKKPNAGETFLSGGT